MLQFWEGKRPNQCHGNNSALTARLLVLLLLFAFCAEARAQPTNLSPASTGIGLDVPLHPAATSFLVTWAMQDSSLDVHEYEVTLRENEFVHEIAYVKGIETTFFDLEPCVTYSVKVQPFDKTGRNVGSPANKNVTTGESAPPSVRSLSAPIITAESFYLTWERPATECVITAYTITYSGVAKWGASIKHSGSATIGPGDADVAKNITINGLQPYTDYAVTVTASTRAGDGQPSVMLNATKQDVPSQPRNLKPLQTSVNSITLLWKEPEEQNGVVGSYKVSWNSSDQPVRDEIATHPVHIITQLTPCTTYTVRVAGITEGGQGEHIEIPVTTEPEAPPQPLDATCRPKTDQTVTMTWAKPETVCSITGYKVTHHKNDPDLRTFSASTFSANFSIDQGLRSSFCVSAVVSNTVDGPQACCEATALSSRMAPQTLTSPKTRADEEENPLPKGGAVQPGNGADQASNSLFVKWISVGAAAAILATMCQ